MGLEWIFGLSDPYQGYPILKFSVQVAKDIGIIKMRFVASNRFFVYVPDIIITKETVLEQHRLWKNKVEQEKNLNFFKVGKFSYN